jgi:hypothetical protein
MPFQPQVGQELTVDDVPYLVAQHPAAPDMPYGQEGKQAVVYQLVSACADPAKAERRALKAFKPRYRVPSLVSLGERIGRFAEFPGLQVCRRIVLTPHRHEALLRQHRDLTYAVLMPWVEGPTWMQVLLEKRPLTAEVSLEIARALADVLARMEQQRLAHCDLSGPNVLLPMLASGEGVALVDIEQMYAPDLASPALLPSGSPGYAHKARDGLWSPNADRFAGALLLAEMLGWCDERVREASWGESYFDPSETQQDSPRSALLSRILHERWGEDVVVLLERAWESDVLSDCATFGEWLVTLPKAVPQRTSVTEDQAPQAALPSSDAAVQALLNLAVQLEQQGNSSGALAAYREAYSLAPAGSGVHMLLARLLQEFEAQRSPRRQRAPGLSKGAAVPATPAKYPVLQDRMLSILHGVHASPVESFLLSAITVAVCAYVLMRTFGTMISRFEQGLWRLDTLVYEMSRSALIAVLSGLTEVLLLRTRIKEKQVVFVAIAAIAGLLGGVVTGAIVRVNEARLSTALLALAGLFGGAVGGALAGLGQASPLRIGELRTRWVAWSTISWAVVWALAGGIGWVVIGPAAPAAVAASVPVATALGLVLLLRVYPEIEF